MLPVVPLFETLDDLEAGSGILQAFLEQPMTRRSLELFMELGSRKAAARAAGHGRLLR